MGNTFGQGWGTIHPTFPLKKSDFGGIWGVAAAGGDPGRVVLGVERGKEREGGGEGPGAQDIGLVAPARMARQGGPRHRRRGAALARAASVATLSRHMPWRDKGYLSRHADWRDQMGYALQIKTKTG